MIPHRAPIRFVFSCLPPVCVACFVCVLALACGHAPQPPNVIVILADTLRADHLGYHGYSGATSPRLDALAAESVVFMRHSSHASRTGPSVASLITGLHPRSHGVINPLTHVDAKGVLGRVHTTLAEILSSQGYRCAGFVANTNISAHFGFSQGFENYQVLNWKKAPLVNQAVFGWLEKQASDPKNEQPLCLYIHYVDPHSPYGAPARFVEFFADPRYSGSVRGTNQEIFSVVSGEREISEPDLQHLQALYDAEIRFFDAQLGELLRELERRELLDESLLVFTSDHGEEFSDHDSLFHGYTLYEEQLRIPLLIRYPGMAPRRVDARSRQIDVLPTILELLGIASPAVVQGQSLVAEMRGNSSGGGARPVLARASIRAQQTVKLDSFTSGDWKYIKKEIPEPAEELFNLRSDPNERHNLVASEPETASRLREEFKRFRRRLPRGTAQVVPLTEQEAEELRALGYLPEK